MPPVTRVPCAIRPMPTDGAASAEPNLFELCRVVTEEGGCQAAVGMYRKGISDDVPCKPYLRPIVRGKENPKAELSQAA